MKTLQLHLVKQMLVTLAMSVGVVSFVMLLMNILKDVLVLLVTGQAGLGLVLHAIFLLLPYILVWSLPIGLLTATLLVFGRFSADQELTAARASGVSLVSLITPVLIVALGLSALAAVINMQIAPDYRMAQKRLIHENLGLNVEKLSKTLPAGTLITDIPGKLIFFGNVTKEGDFEDFYVFDLNENGEEVSKRRAQTARLSPTNSNLILLFGVTIMHYDSTTHRWIDEGSIQEAELIIPPAKKRSDTVKPKLTAQDMTFFELRAELDRANRRQIRKEMNPEEIKQTKRETRTKGVDLVTKIRVQMHHQVAFSLASISFVLVGIPLGIQAHRRETSIGVVISLLLVVIYYSFLVIASSLESQTRAFPHLIVWIPNFIFQIAGGFMLWRANRGAV